METEIKVSEDFSQDLVMFQPYDLVIAKMKEEYSGLAINGVNDKEGYAKVHAARMNVKNKRIEVDKVTKMLTEVGVRRNKAIYNERNRIADLLAPIEKDLDDKENSIDQERLRLKKEENERLDRLAQSRAGQLIAVGDLAPNYLDLKVMPEDMFQKVLADQKKLFDEETVRIAKQKEEERVAAEKAEAQRKIIEEQQKKIAELERQKTEELRKKWEEDKRLADEAEIKHLAEIKAKQLLEEQEKQRLLTEQREKERLERERKKAEKIERLKPDKTRMLDLKTELTLIPLPVVKSPEYIECVQTVKSRILSLCALIDDTIKKSEE